MQEGARTCVRFCRPSLPRRAVLGCTDRAPALSLLCRESHPVQRQPGHPLPAVCCSRSWAWPSAHLAVQRSAEVHMGTAARLLAPPLKVRGVGEEGISWPLAGLPSANRALPSCPSFLLSSYLRTMDAVCACSFLCKNYSCMGRHLSFLISPLLPPCPEGFFSSRLSSKRARDTAGKQSGTKQTFLIQIAWIKPNFPFTRSATCK